MLNMGDKMKEKNKVTALLLCIFGFIFGLHHWYLGNWKKALLFTITAGGLYIWWIHDIIRLAFDKNYISNYKTCTSFKEEWQKDLEMQRRKIEIEKEIKRSKMGQPVQCPKCGCTSIGMTNKKLSLGRAATGGFLFGTAGAMVGGVTSKKLFNVCQGCGYRWQPGKR